MKKKLIIFIKYPEPGKVKTRLAKTIGSKKAALIYKRLIIRTVKKVSSLQRRDIEIIIAYTPKSKKTRTVKLIGKHFIYHLQKGINLGERLINALKFGFLNGVEKIIIIGSDCPQINQSLIKDAIGKLSRHDVVIGPSADGGYYLIGLKKENSSLFKEMPWSTPQVLKKTLNKIRKANLSCKLLPVRSDIDTYEDFKKHGKKIKS